MVTVRKIMKIKKKAIIKTKLIPEIKTVAPQVNISKIDWPMSG